MKKLIRPLTALLFSAVIILLGIGIYIIIAFSWFTNTEFVEPDLSGFSVSAYFGGGKGTEDDPFLIKNQRHLYNLCWLQYLGYFNKVGSLNANGQYVSGGSTLTQYSFSIEQDLNMSGWCLPPIGTTLQPFIGILNGNGHSVYNLKTTNLFSEFGTKHPSSVNASNFANVDVIGFMGVVGTISSMANNDKSIDTDANAVANIKLKDNTVKTITDNTLIGIAAGYINGYVEDIGIVDSGLDIKSTKLANMENISYYTVAGYATDEYVVKTSKTKTMVLNPTDTVKTSYVYSDEGDTTGWGGSIDMKSLWTRISYYSSYNNHSYGLNFITSETRTVTSSGVTVKDQVTGQRYYTSDYTAGKYAKETLANTGDYASGVYLLDKQNVQNKTEWNYLTALYKSVRFIYVHDETTVGYKITDDNGNFLNLNDGTSYGNCTLANGIDEDSATVWVYENNKLYTYSKYDGYIYWLNTTESELSVSYTDPGNEITTPINNSATSWTYDSTVGSYYSTTNNVKQYIYYDEDEEWTLETPDFYYRITDGNGNYLSVSGTTIVNVTNANEATEWYFSNPGENASGYIEVYTNGNWYYLGRNNGDLVLTTNYYGNTWNNLGNGLFYENKSINYNDGVWSYSAASTSTSEFYIKNGNNYLTISGTTNPTTTNPTTTNTTNINEAIAWTFSNSGSSPSGKISTKINGTTYYLVAGNGSLTLSTSNQIDYTNDGRLYYYSNRYYYYIRYNYDWTGYRNNKERTGPSYNMTLQPVLLGAKPIFSSEYMPNIGSTISDDINKVTLDIKDLVSKQGYIPLNTNDMSTDGNYNVTIKNTGYIIGGGHETTKKYKGDIRVSQYAISNVSTGYNSSTKKFETILTVNNSGFVTIYENNAVTNAGLNYVKFDDSRYKFLNKALSGSSYVYGLHFMDTLISKDKLITADRVLINGTYYPNYQMPEDCIDFQLAEKGYINFFAGDFFSSGDGNKSFCSLHQIFRNGSNEIIDIKHITKIFAKKDSNGNEIKNANYIYLYSDGTYSEPLESGYELAFDAAWIENPGIGIAKNIYYFEIPSNAGEYALGAVEDLVGGYIFYLDIGANAQEIHRTTITQKSTLTQYDYVYPKGIVIINAGTKIDDEINSASLNAANSSVLEIKTVSGQKTIAVSRTSNTSINAVTDIDVTSTYIPRTQTLTKNSGAMTATAVKTTTSIYSQIQYIDHNTTTGNIFETTIQQINSEAPTYKIYKIGEGHTTEGFTPVEIDTTSLTPAWKLYAVVDSKNVLIDMTNSSDANATTIKTQLTNIAASTGTTILDYEYDTVTEATNTYAIHINMALNSSDLYYYIFTGNDITVTTDNVGGITIYVITSNTGTFVLNDTTNMVVGTDITVAAS